MQHVSRMTEMAHIVKAALPQAGFHSSSHQNASRSPAPGSSGASWTRGEAQGLSGLEPAGAWRCGGAAGTGRRVQIRTSLSLIMFDPFSA